ncbi:MAG: site-specific integrase [Bacteroidota bacterium]
MAHSIKLIRKNKALTDKTFPIMLQIIKDGKVKLFSTGISCLINEWDGNQLKKPHPNYQQRNLILQQNFKTKALKIIDEFTRSDTDFTLVDFEMKFRGNIRNQKITVYEHFQARIELMKISGRIGNARSYTDTCNSFFSFNKDKDLNFKNLNHNLLEKYEAFLRSRGNQDSGIAFRMRSIRAVYNSAIKSEIINKENYPFETYKIAKLKGKGLKRALSREEIKRILDLDIKERPDLIDSKNYFIFSYFVQGINFIDMMKLKKSNIKDGTIEYIRSKTKSRFIVKILPPVQKIINYYSDQKFSTDYIFPLLLKNNLTPEQIENRKNKTLKKFNKDLKDIGKLAKVDKNITSYVIRHSFATNLKQLGVSADIISQSMGHSNLDVTNNYLAEFENSIINDANEKLLVFEQ